MIAFNVTIKDNFGRFDRKLHKHMARSQDRATRLWPVEPGASLRGCAHRARRPRP